MNIFTPPWKWELRMWYGDKAAPEDRGRLCMDLVFSSRHSFDMDLDFARNRSDIGRIEYRELNPSSDWVVDWH